MTALLFHAEKHPGDERPIVFDFTAYLAVGETISNVTLSVPAAVVHPTNYTQSGAEVRVWVKAGSAGTAYRIICTILTNAARKEVMECNLRVAQP